MAQSHHDLLVWQKAMDMTVSVYEVSRRFPREETYGLTSQIRRAAVSVASNIAEGRGRLTQGEFRQFLGTAQGSNLEVQTQLSVAKRLGYATPDSLEHAQTLSIEVGKMLSSLIASVQLKAKS